MQQMIPQTARKRPQGVILTQTEYKIVPKFLDQMEGHDCCKE